MNTNAPTVSAGQTRRKATCPIWHSPLFIVSAEGIECRCTSCRGEKHLYTWDNIAQMRADVAQGNAVAFH